MAKFRRGSPNVGVECKVVWKNHDFDQYIALSLFARGQHCFIYVFLASTFQPDKDRATGRGLLLLMIMFLQYFLILPFSACKVWAKRRFKTPERYLRAKYKREFELNEKIVSNTLWAQLQPNGRLVVGAVVKHQPPHPHHPAQSTTSTSGGGTDAPASTTAGSDANDRDDAASDNAETTSFPPEAAAAQCPDILITCPGIMSTDDSGRCSSPDKK